MLDDLIFVDTKIDLQRADVKSMMNEMMIFKDDLGSEVLLVKEFAAHIREGLYSHFGMN